MAVLPVPDWALKGGGGGREGGKGSEGRERGERRETVSHHSIMVQCSQ